MNDWKGNRESLLLFKNDPRRELQDKADIQNLMRKNPKLDHESIKRYADLFDEWKTIQELKKGI